MTLELVRVAISLVTHAVLYLLVSSVDMLWVSGEQVLAWRPGLAVLLILLFLITCLVKIKTSVENSRRGGVEVHVKGPFKR